MTKANEYVEKYAAEAMEQMRKYGIPASVTLAQGIIESASGESELARKGNNHFGVKASRSWIEKGGSYLIYSDDRPDEKFCRYRSTSDSFEHHSLILKANSRYAHLFTLSPTDYVGWTKGLQQSGYATNKSYALALQAVIKTNGLDRFDKMVVSEKKSQETEVKQQDNTISVKQQEDRKIGNQNTEQNFFNSLFSQADAKDSWKSLFEEESTYISNPITNLLSTLFASLLAVALRVDGEEAHLQPNANTLLSQNYEKELNQNTNQIKKARS